MKNILIFSFFLFTFINYGLCETTKADEAQIKELWASVEVAKKKRLPKTAIEHLDKIIEITIKNKDYASATNAITQKIDFEGRIQGQKAEEKIIRLERERNKAPQEVVPILDSIMAIWYWQYFNQNKWRFMQRTRTETEPSKDIKTWDLARIMTEIDNQFTKALSNPELLKKIPLKKYAKLLQMGNSPESYRPTLYDFLAFNALKYYQSGERAGTQAQDAFDLKVNSPVFSSAEDFLAWGVKTTDPDSRIVKAIHLFQEVLKFHKNEKQNDAFIDANLHRIAFANNAAKGEDKVIAYRKALNDFILKYKDHVITSRAYFALAKSYESAQDLVEARRLAHIGSKNHPDSHGGKLCHNLIQNIERNSIAISSENIWNEPFPKINVNYKNLKRVYFKAISYDWVDVFESKDQYKYPNHKNLEQWLKKRADAVWFAALPETKDYKLRNHELEIPKDLKPGSYYIFASSDAEFKKEENTISYMSCWVSNLSVVTRTGTSTAPDITGFVLDVNTGDPIEGAFVKAMESTGYGKRKKVRTRGPFVTDKHGYFKINSEKKWQTTLLAEYKGNSISTHSVSNAYMRRPIKPREMTTFFTDRSIYRPGQIVQYKGISYLVDKENDNYKTLDGKKVTITFRDRNHKEIEKQSHVTNEFGSFSGSFTAPRDRLMGRMTIRTNGGPHGAISFNVEEYKRPKFRVSLSAPEKPAKLNAEVSIKGSAKAYTGVSINDAKVNYRVVRNVQWPVWYRYCYWWRPAPQSLSQEISNGILKTDEDGNFEIKFFAKPDPSASEKDEPTFRYSIYTDVTDSNGETRSASKMINLGFTALKASLSAPAWLDTIKAVELKVHTASLNDIGESAVCKIKVHELVQPSKVHRKKMPGHRGHHYYSYRENKNKPSNHTDLSNIHSWPNGQLFQEATVKTDLEGKGTLKLKMPAGIYRANLKTKDKFGKEIIAQVVFKVLAPDAKNLNIKIPNLVEAPKWSLQPGEEFSVLWGSGYKRARAFCEVEHRGKVLQKFWTDEGVTQRKISQKITEAMRGGLYVRITMIREGRAYLSYRKINVPWNNKNLELSWEHFTSKLGPSDKETWTAVIKGPKAESLVGEMVAGLYDASLDAYKPHHWMKRFNQFRIDYKQLSSRFNNHSVYANNILNRWKRDHKNTHLSYPSFQSVITSSKKRYGYARSRYKDSNMLASRSSTSKGMVRAQAASMPFSLDNSTDMEMKEGESISIGSVRAKGLSNASFAKANVSSSNKTTQANSNIDLSKVSLRKNLKETAFFFPHLISDKKGVVKMEFTMPEALTEWKFLGFAHDKNMRSGSITGTTVTAKDLMVTPNPPRFIREGDVLEFTVKVSNQSPTIQRGKVRLSFTDLITQKIVDQDLGSELFEKDFELASKTSKTFSWKITTPLDMNFLSYKAVASTGKLSDGEEGLLPVLSSRILVTESICLPIRNVGEKKFSFTKLLNANDSKTLSHKKLKVEMVSQPAWYAVMALPYLMESCHESSEQVFNRYYGNALGRHIAQSDPKIKTIFDQWRGTDALDSPLEKNQDIKSVMLEETPWLRNGKNESKARRNVAILFDNNRLNRELKHNLDKLKNYQLWNGYWSWMPKGRKNLYITQYIMTGFARLRHLGVKVDMKPAVKAANALDTWLFDIYKKIVDEKRLDKNNMSSNIAFYLYGRSFLLEDTKLSKKHQEAFNYFLKQAEKYWVKFEARQTQAHIALALKRFGYKETSRAIMTSIKEYAINEEEMGMYWRDTEHSFWWYRAPIETQALMIEGFDEIMNDQQSVEDCKVWLLKQKQTQDWKTTKATADAIYGLLLRGFDLLSSNKLVQVSLDNTLIKPKKVEAGTGYYQMNYLGSDVNPKMGDITVKKEDEGVSWGSVHWQYVEDMTKVTPHSGTPLKLVKKLFKKVNTKSGPTLVEISDNALEVGDELVVRIELKTDRDMEYVHMKDQRGSGTEPVNVLSRYRYQDGLGYYESTKDTASHFYIDYLPKGTYVFEYSTRIVHKGKYQTGIANIQSMYAPEFNSHSESFMLKVK